MHPIAESLCLISHHIAQKNTQGSGDVASVGLPDLGLLLNIAQSYRATWGWVVYMVVWPKLRRRGNDEAVLAESEAHQAPQEAEPVAVGVERL